MGFALGERADFSRGRLKSGFGVPSRFSDGLSVGRAFMPDRRGKFQKCRA
ncbi:hypothetical protein HMPREF9123_0662 [Neisseria bacilliformis ATCC BAA-1200]|uniref:Uncharacterized protein n=1 Tax=Neisseria bacilliformis ATCC BAA-1200 TaxID=888742 RepID=F2BA86_9NEIS|nr:hypothetical protein HMPREF9123_0662 [Neisseria bacilliformis ATCC BAA-1200]